MEHWFFQGNGKKFDSDIKEPLQRGDLYWPAMPDPENRGAAERRDQQHPADRRLQHAHRPVVQCRHSDAARVPEAEHADRSDGDGGEPAEGV